MSKQYARAKEIFLMVCDLPADQRRAIVDRECAGDAALRAEVESLLAHHDAPDQHRHHGKRLDDAETVSRLISRGAGGGGTDFNVETGAPQPTPERIGQYRVIRRLGVGGMGIVYLAARDDDQFKKRVAIKVIKKGMDSEEILRRFNQERQVLSALNHPNVARMIDGGATEDGRPYFVMEYIEGMAIDEYSDKNRLRIEERLELFRTLCHAVQHAHQNLIVHRDIKPSNVVVTQDGTVKLLDFGIAKLLNPEMSAFAAEPTATSLRLMTPEYASPEQVRGDPLSTASDVYSLGVLLYELVTGRRPYRFKTRLQSEIERIICTEDPEKPSTALTHPQEGDAQPVQSTLTPQAPGGTEGTTPASTIEEIAKLREAKPERLKKRLSGDIDNIVLMAMRKEPRRRYVSAEQFAEDIRRHLEGMPVIARSLTIRYRLGKFVQRNKAGVAAAAILVLLLIGWGVSAFVLWRTAERERDFAVAMQGRLEEVFDLSSKTLSQVNSEIRLLPGAHAVRDEVSKIMTDFSDKSLIIANELDASRAQARIYMSVGDFLGGTRTGNTGATAKALEHYQKAQNILQTLSVERPSDSAVQSELAIAHLKVSDMQRATGLSDEAIATRRKALDIAEKLAQASPKSEDAKRVLATTLLAYGDSLTVAEKPTEAIEAFSRSVEIRDALALAKPDDVTAIRESTVGHTRLADALRDQKRYSDAKPHYQRVLSIRQALWEADKTNTQRRRDLALAHYWISQNLLSQSDEHGAIESLQAARELLAKLRVDDPTDARVQADLGRVFFSLGEATYIKASEEPALSNTQIQQQLASEAQGHYGECAALLEPLAMRTRSLLGLVAPMFERWAAVDTIARDNKGALEHKIKARDYYRELKSDADVQRLDAELAQAGAAE